MRRADAPRAGWYPDPVDRSRLRWWDGLDWTDRRRAPPRDSELTAASERAEAMAAAAGSRPAVVAGGRAISRQETQEIIAEVRSAARSEVERASEVLTQRAQSARRELAPLISEYTSRFTRIARRVAIIVVVLVIAWFVFQAIAQATFFEWLGDRIDSLSSHPTTHHSSIEG